MHWTQKDARMSRRCTTQLLDWVEQGVIDKDSLIRDLLVWMDENEVEQFARGMDYITGEDEDEDEDED